MAQIPNFILIFFIIWLSGSTFGQKPSQKKDKWVVNRRDLFSLLAQGSHIPRSGQSDEFAGNCAPKIMHKRSETCFYRDMIFYVQKCCTPIKSGSKPYCTSQKYPQVVYICGGPKTPIFYEQPYTIDFADMPITTDESFETEEISNPPLKIVSTKKPSPPKKTKSTKRPSKTTKKATTTTTPKPTNTTSKRLLCYSCEAVQGDSSLACKDDPKTTLKVYCDPGHVCRTVTYVSEARGGSTLIRGCVNPNDIKPLTRKSDKKDKKTKKNTKNKNEKCMLNPSYLPTICDGDECDFGTCDCFCDTNLCNNVRYGGQGWNACIA